MKLALSITLLNMFLALISFARAKNVVERTINFDLCFLSALGFLTLSGLESKNSYYFDFLIVGILLSFVGSVLIIRYQLSDQGLE